MLLQEEAMKRRISNKTLENRIKKWQHVLKLDGWTIRFKFVSPMKMENDKFILAMVNHCSPNEKVADLLFNNKYQTYTGFGVSWNIDTLIIHELIHVHLYEKAEPFEATLNKDNIDVFEAMEEFICDSFAKIIFDSISLEKNLSQ